MEQKIVRNDFNKAPEHRQLEIADFEDCRLRIKETYNGGAMISAFDGPVVIREQLLDTLIGALQLIRAGK